MLLSVHRPVCLLPVNMRLSVCAFVYAMVRLGCHGDGQVLTAVALALLWRKMNVDTLKVTVVAFVITSALCIARRAGAGH